MKTKTLKNQITGLCTISFLVILLHSATFLNSDPPTDAQISNAIYEELVVNATTPFYSIDIETHDGIVTLSGTVNDLLAKDRVVKVAQMVKGVRGVIDEIEIDTPDRTDFVLETEVKDALINDPATESYDIDVSVREGTVFLTGTVDSWQEKKISGFVVKGIPGVKKLDNQLDVDYDKDRSDQDIELEIQQALQYDVRVDGSLIDADVELGKVTLSGVVGSAAEKQLAIADAWVRGVRSVNSDQLEVKQWARDEKLRKEKYVEKTDEDIKDAVETAFSYDPRVLPFEVKVNVDNGYVTLSGIVDNLQAKIAAEHDARNIVGVFGVNNNLKVRPGDIPEDSALETDLNRAMRNKPVVENWQIDVTVNNGKVYLSGEVDSQFEKSQAEDIASKTKGVVEVINNLEVQDTRDSEYSDYYGWNSYYSPMLDVDKQFKASDAEIKNSIESQLWWSPYVNQEDVEVSVSNGIAVLEGTVETEREKRYAKINALQGGAKEVENNIMVEYSAP